MEPGFRRVRGQDQRSGESCGPAQRVARGRTGGRRAQTGREGVREGWFELPNRQAVDMMNLTMKTIEYEESSAPLFLIIIFPILYLHHFNFASPRILLPFSASINCKNTIDSLPGNPSPVLSAKIKIVLNLNKKLLKMEINLHSSSELPASFLVSVLYYLLPLGLLAKMLFIYKRRT